MVGSSQNVLISSAGRRGELVKIFREVLSSNGGGKVFTCDVSPLTSAGWLSDGLELVPRVSDPNFVPRLLEICAARKISHVIPTIDTELPVLAAAARRFQDAGVTVWVSDLATVEIAQDKRSTNEWLRTRGIPVADQVDLADALRDFPDDLPRIAKPSRGSSSIGLALIESMSDLESLDESLDYVIESVAQGAEFTVDVLVDRDGTCQVAVPRRRLETRAGEVSKGVTVFDEDLQALAVEVVECLPGAFGVLNVQIFKEPSTGRMCVIEVNARFGGGFPLSWAAGARMPWWLLQRLQGQDPEASLDWVAGKLMLRYDAACFLDIEDGALEW